MTEECCVCKQPIKGDCIESGKKFYHPLCMRCFVCGDALRGQYFTFEGEPICERDYKVSRLVIISMLMYLHSDQNSEVNIV